MVEAYDLNLLPMENYVIESKVMCRKTILVLSDEFHQTLFSEFVNFFQTNDHMTINGRSCINFATYNYFNFINDESIEKCVLDAIDKYGIGSCGPRAFYGTFGKYFDINYFYFVETF